MKSIKVFAFAAILATMALFVGASTASATVLCKTTGTGLPTGTTCPANQAYPAGTEIHAVLETGQHFTLTTHSEFAPNFTCETSTLQAKTANEGSATETVKGTIEALTFEKCNCEVKVLKNGAGNFGSLEVHWIEGTHNGTVTASGTEITTVCASIFGSIHCIYVFNNTDLGVLKDTSEGGTLETNNQPIPRLTTSGLCPEAPTVDAKYIVTTPTPLSVAGHT